MTQLTGRSSTTGERAKANRPRASRRLVRDLLIAGVVVMILLPILFMVTTSFKEPVEIRRSGALLPEEGVHVVNWVRAYRNVPVHRFLLNSLIAAVGSAALAVVIAFPVSYAISRFRLGGSLLMGWILGTFIVPPIVISVPVFFMFRTLGLLDSKLGLTLIHAVASLPVAVWLLHGFIKKIPIAIDQAAWVDGASRVQTLGRVIAPIAGPGIIATFIIAMILSMNEFLFALTLTFSLDAQTFPIGISNFIGEHGQQFGEMSAAALGGLVPIFALIFFFQRYLVEGLSSGAVK